MAEEYHQVTLFEPMDLTVFPADCQGLTVDVELKQDIHEAELVPFEDGTPLADVLVDRCFLKDFRLMEMPRRNEAKSRLQVLANAMRGGGSRVDQSRTVSANAPKLVVNDNNDNDDEDTSDEEQSAHPDGPKQVPYCIYLGLPKPYTPRHKP
jgi:hypothetical protein